MDLYEVPERNELTYRCQYCGGECVAKRVDGQPQWPVTKLGTYGANATPAPATDDVELYADATTISFTAASGSTPAKINDSAELFESKIFFHGGMVIVVTTTSGVNDGVFTIADRGVAKGVLTLSSSDSLTTEAAAAAGTVTISQRLYQPGTMSGCPHCGSLNSK